MTRFTMFTVASPAYQEVAELCVPSWRRNSGAESVEVFTCDDPTHRNTDERWRNAVVLRAKAWANAVRTAVSTGLPIVLMDVDCLVLKPISGGFDGEHPIAVARWPIINIGVLFVDVRLPFPFVEFFDEWAARVAVTPQNPTLTADQTIMQEKLHQREECVNKLPASEWNLTFGIRNGPERLDAYPNPRIVHLHWWSFQRLGVAVARSRLEPLFPEAFAG